MKLKDICEFIVDCPHSTAKDEGGGYPLIRTPNIGKGRLLLDGVHRVSEEVYQSRISRGIPSKNDLILAREAPIGNVAIIKNEGRICLGQRTVLLRPDKNCVNPDFLMYYLISPEQQGKLIGSSNGATVNHLNMVNIRNLDVNIPCLKVQSRIASILSAYDDLIENNQKQIKLLEEAAQRLYKEWFVDLRFPGHEDVEIVDGLPVGWEEKRLDEVAYIIMGQSPKSEFYNNEFDGLPFHQGVGTYGNRYVKDDIYSSVQTKVAEAGSILFSVRAPVGRLNITKNKIIIGRGLSAMNHKQGYQSYLFYLLKERFFKEDLMGNGSVYASISKDELCSIKFVVPNKEIVKFFNEITKDIDYKILMIDEQIRSLKEARDRLLPKLMSGEVEV